MLYDMMKKNYYNHKKTTCTEYTVQVILSYSFPNASFHFTVRVHPKFTTFLPPPPFFF